MKPNETQFSHPNGQRLQFSKPNIFEVDLHDESIRSRYPPPSSSLSWSLFFCVLLISLCRYTLSRMPLPPFEEPPPEEVPLPPEAAAAPSLGLGVLLGPPPGVLEASPP